jgi:hypothetical protein
VNRSHHRRRIGLPRNPGECGNSCTIEINSTVQIRIEGLRILQYVPRVIITDKLKSYGAAKREILPGVEYRQSRYLNNRCENSHRPTR